MATTISEDTAYPEGGDVTGCISGSGEVRVNGEVKTSDALPEKTKEIDGIMGKILDTNCENMNEEDKTSKASLSNGASIDNISSDGDSDIGKNDCDTEKENSEEEVGKISKASVRNSEKMDDEKMDVDESCEEAAEDDEKKGEEMDSTVNSAKADNHLENNSDAEVEKRVNDSDDSKDSSVEHMDVSQVEDEDESERSVRNMTEGKGRESKNKDTEDISTVSDEMAEDEKQENVCDKSSDTAFTAAEEKLSKNDGKAEDSNSQVCNAASDKEEEKESEKKEDKDIEIVVEKSATKKKCSGSVKNMSELERHLRRSTRKCTRNRKYDDSDIEEVELIDPLADADPLADPLGDPLAGKDPLYSKPPEKSAIVVKDTKSLAQLASERKNAKKEPTLVIIDTNSILSGRGPVPVSTGTTSASQNAHTPCISLPAAVPAQGLYPATQGSSYVYPQQNGQKQAHIYSQQSSLMDSDVTDDTYIVEAPSFIVPYVYEKPPKEAIKAYIEKINKEREEEEHRKKEEEHRKKEEEHRKKEEEHRKKEEEHRKKEEEDRKKEEEQKEKDAEKQKKEDSEKQEEDTEKQDEEEDSEKQVVVGSEKQEKEDAVQRSKEEDAEEQEKENTENQEKVEEEEGKEEKEVKNSEKSLEDVKEPESHMNKKRDDDTENKILGEEKEKKTQGKSSDEKSVTTKEKDEGKRKEEDSTKDKEEKVEDKKGIPTAQGGKTNTEASNDKTLNSDGTVKEVKKRDSFFECALGKMLTSIGLNLVQEYVQTDLLRSQKRKADREGGRGSAETQHAIHSLLKNLENSKENNEPFHFEQKKCEFCSFKTESRVVMAHHLETPHMRNYVYRCNFCSFETRSPQVILFHMEAEHNVRGRLERAPFFHQCPSCPFEDNSKAKLNRHMISCQKKFKQEKNQEPPSDWDPPAKIAKPPPVRGRPNILGPNYTPVKAQLPHPLLPKPTTSAPPTVAQPTVPGAVGQNRPRGRPIGSYKPTDTRVQQLQHPGKPLVPSQIRQGMFYRPTGTVAQPQVYIPTAYQMSGNQIYQVVSNQGQVVPMIGGNFNNVPRFTIIPTSTSGSSLHSSNPTPVALVPNLASSLGSITIQSANTRQAQVKTPQQPSISITPLPRQSTAQSTPITTVGLRPGQPTNQKTTFVICEICDGYIKDLEQLRNHMQWIHKVKIHPKMIYNRPPLNCQKCQFRFFTDQGLERHLLGTHGLVTSSMQEAANKGQDSGRCPVCGKVYQWKLLNHVAKDHNMTLKPAHLSYKCTVCTATFGMYKLFENHVYSAHSMVAKRVMDHKKPGEAQTQKQSPQLSQQTQSILRPLKINDEITIIPQPVKIMPVSSRSSSVTIHQVTRKLQCEVCGFLFDRAYFPQFVNHYQRKHLKKCGVNLCKFDKCPTCQKKYMTEKLMKYLENRKVEPIDVIEITDDEVVIAGRGKNEITITKVNQSTKKIKEGGGISGSKKTVEIIDLDSPMKKPLAKHNKPCPRSRKVVVNQAECENDETLATEDSNLAAVKARLRRRKSLEISTVKSVPRREESTSITKTVKKQNVKVFYKPCPKSRRPAHTKNDPTEEKEDGNSLAEERKQKVDGEVKKKQIKSSLQKPTKEEGSDEEEADKNETEEEEEQKEVEDGETNDADDDKNTAEEERITEEEEEKNTGEDGRVTEEEDEKNTAEEERVTEEEDERNDTEEDDEKNDTEEEDEKNDTEDETTVGEVDSIERDNNLLKRKRADDLESAEDGDRKKFKDGGSSEDSEAENEDS